MIRETQRNGTSGLFVLLLLIAVGVAIGFALKGAIDGRNVLLGVIWAFAALVWFVLLFGFKIVQPNQGRVLQFFGDYVGTLRKAGLVYVNPFFTAKSISLRVRNFETGKLKVNDNNSNPIEIGSVVVWQVVDTAEAMFEVDDYEEYVRVQSEAALRGLANHYAYDAHGEGEISLSGRTAEVAERLKQEIQDRLEKAGVRVLEARISHLAYAPEIASAMLRRQQASAVIAARKLIVEGAVGMVELALEQLASKQIVKLDDERRAAMVSNLLVVLCSEQQTTPVVNTGTLYQ